jgi:uncharacterized protein (DUF2236 family)
MSISLSLDNYDLPDTVLHMDIVKKSRSAVTAGLRGLLTDPAYAVNRDSSPGDPGLCGPGSASWVVLSDPAALFAGVRSLLLQSCHPSAIAGVEDHSDYQSDVLGRLKRTVAYVTLSVFGSKDEAETMADRVKMAHSFVKGVRPDGVPYDASDPRLLTWVHVALVDSLLVCHQTFGRERLSDTDCDRFISEQADILALLGVQNGPRSATELREALESFKPELRKTDGSLRASSFLKNPPLPLSYKLVYPVIFNASAETLPEFSKPMLGLRASPAAVATVKRLSGGVLSGLLDWLLEAPESKSAATERLSKGKQ